MRPVQLDPAIRSALKARSPVSYREYLKTNWWFQRRNQALRDANYRCAVCESKRNLQVHHTSYEHLGAELPEDLEVVCRGCHLGHHYNETQEGIGIYTRVLSEVIQDSPSMEFSDVIEEAKQRCAKRKIHLHPDRFNAAVARVNSRINFRPPERSRELYEVAEQGKPLTKAEAAGLMLKYGGFAAVKHMPEVKPRSLRQAEHMSALGILMQAIADQTDRCQEAEQAAHDAEEKP
jgi:hypothetical protein